MSHSRRHSQSWLRHHLDEIAIQHITAHYFADDIFKLIFVNENHYVFIQISSKFNRKVPINDKPDLAQIMPRRRTGSNLSFESVMALFSDAYMCHSASLSQHNTTRETKTKRLDLKHSQVIYRPKSTICRVSSGCWSHNFVRQVYVF